MSIAPFNTERKTMSTEQEVTETAAEETQAQNQEQDSQMSSEFRAQLLCRVVDVETSLLTAFQRFIEEKKSSLEDMMLLAKEELSKIELFAPKSESETTEQ